MKYKGERKIKSQGGLHNNQKEGKRSRNSPVMDNSSEQPQKS